MSAATGVVDSMPNLFVEATLVRSDSEVELPLSMAGNRVIRLTAGTLASFKKLKILSTSQQQGTLFRVRFQLKRYIGSVFDTVPGAYAVSNPIEVFSHTQYLSNKRRGKFLFLLSLFFVFDQLRFKRCCCWFIVCFCFFFWVARIKNVCLLLLLLLVVFCCLL